MAETAPLDLIRPDWPAPASVHAFATGRAGGVSGGPFASLNLGDHVGDDPASVVANRERLRCLAGLPAEPRWLRQVHGATVATPEAPPAEADAMFTQQPDVVCVVLTADCLPVLLCDTAGRHAAAAHAGWRGLAAGIIEATVKRLRAAGAGELIAWLGPAISAAAYEVGPEVRDALLSADPAAGAGFTRNARGRWQMDLPGLARRRLRALGIAASYGGELCTHGEPGRFFSHRRDGATGRQATLIWLGP